MGGLWHEIQTWGLLNIKQNCANNDTVMFSFNVQSLKFHMAVFLTLRMKIYLMATFYKYKYEVYLEDVLLGSLCCEECKIIKS
jgi:hypothetical protein